MSHEVDSMFNVGEVPWHGLGIVLENPPATMEEALEKSGLDWWASAEPMFRADGEKVEDHRLITRSDTGAQLGVVGSSYMVLQNEDAFDWFGPMVEDGLIEVVSAGALKGGRRVWVQARVVGAEEEVRPGDVVRQHLLMAHSHDGTMNVRGDFCAVRVVCANTLRMAHGESGMIFRLKHTSRVHERLEYQRNFVEEQIESFRGAIGVARRMARREVKGGDFVHYVDEVFRSQGSGLERISNKILRLFEEGRGNGGGTVWDLYNAATEYLNWERGKEVDSRIDSLWFGEAANTNDRAWTEAWKLAAA